MSSWLCLLLLLTYLSTDNTSSAEETVKGEKDYREIERDFLRLYGKSDQISSEIGNSGMKNRIKWCKLAYKNYLKKDVIQSSKIPSTKGINLEFRYERHTVMLVDVVSCPPEKNFFIRESVFKGCMYIVKKKHSLSSYFYFGDEICNIIPITSSWSGSLSPN